MRRMDRGGREDRKREERKPKAKEERMTKTTQLKPEKVWDGRPHVVPLTPRPCQYRSCPGHHLIVCSDCLGFPED